MNNEPNKNNRGSQSISLQLSHCSNNQLIQITPRIWRALEALGHHFSFCQRLGAECDRTRKPDKIRSGGTATRSIPCTPDASCCLVNFKRPLPGKTPHPGTLVLKPYGDLAPKLTLPGEGPIRGLS